MMNLLTSDRTPRSICKWILRAIFNDAHIDYRAQVGELEVEESKKPHPPRPESKMPEGTVSRMLTFSLHGQVLAKAHWYDRPDRPTLKDPKWMLTPVGVFDPYVPKGHHCSSCRPELGDPDYGIDRPAI